MKYISEHRTGLIGTLVTHGVILIFLLYFGILITNTAKPVDEGILVNFGDSETGLGLEEPAPGEREPSVKPIESASEKIVVPPASTKKVSSEADDPIVTQDLEPTVSVKTSKKTVTQKVIDPEKQRLAEEERLQKAEQLRQQKVDQQRLAQEAADQRKIGEINSRAKNVFGGGGKGSPDSKSTSQGVTYGPGNQGSSEGVANAEKYGPGGGTGTSGVSFNLDGRTQLRLPKPEFLGNQDEKVVVTIYVDRKGQVTRAVPGAKGSTTNDQRFWDAAKKAALETTFNVKETAPSFQIGTIIYHFRLD